MVSDTTVYDDDGLLQQVGDRLYKNVNIDDNILYTQSQLDDLAQDFLREFVKEHSKISVNIMYAPYLKVGQTISLTDSYNDISSVNYFVESISETADGNYGLVLAKYPA